MKKKILICDYPNALECNYEPTMQSVKTAWMSRGKQQETELEFEVYAYEGDAKLIQKLQGVTGLITGFLEIGEHILAEAESLSCITVSGEGYSNIDMEAAKRHGVTVCHIREYCTEEVAEHAFALIGALNRNLKYYTNKTEQEKEWKYHTIAGGKNLSSQTLAIFGYGKIGKRVAQIANAYGMEVLAVDPYAASHEEPKRLAEQAGVTLIGTDEALERADILSNHMNLTAENYHFFDDMAFEKMKQHPIFINVGRGKSVDEAALLRALDTGKIRAAGLDVLEAEEPDLEKCGLLGRDNVIITPHSAFYSSESIEKLQLISGANLGYFLAGNPKKIDEIVTK